MQRVKSDTYDCANKQATLFCFQLAAALELQLVRTLGARQRWLMQKP